MQKTTPERPLVTFTLFAYNQEEYIREAIEGAFSQTYEPLEIILSDDCSTDRTFEIMQEMAAGYEGPHEVKVRQCMVNLGLAGHVNEVLQESHGSIYVIAAGDDISLPHRVGLSVNLLNDNPNATAVLLSADVVDQTGKVIGERISKLKKGQGEIQTINDLLSWHHTTFGATRAMRREVFSEFGEINNNCPTEDSPLLVRSLICGCNVLSQDKAVLYRRHNNNLSGIASLKDMDISAIYQQYESDLDKAVALGLITDNLAMRLRDWLSADHRARLVKLNVSINKKITLSDLFFFMRHPSLSFVEKVKFMIKSLLSSKAIGL